MKSKKTAVLIQLLAVAGLVGIIVLPAATVRGEGGRPGSDAVIYVSSQGLYFDTFVSVDPLPFKGPFQALYLGPNGPTTDAGPGDPGYLGGRWWMDTNGNGEMDPDDHYFLCPLLPPGRENP